MNELFDAIDHHHSESGDNWEAYQAWWEEITNEEFPAQASGLSMIQAATLMCYGGNIGMIPDEQMSAFVNAVEATRAKLREQYNMSGPDQKLFIALRSAPYEHVDLVDL